MLMRLSATTILDVPKTCPTTMCDVSPHQGAKGFPLIHIHWVQPLDVG
jgi:hypothetical protein